jgi:hypothetical protein
MSSTGCLAIQASPTPCAIALAMSSAQRAGVSLPLVLPPACLMRPLGPYTTRSSWGPPVEMGPGLQMVTPTPLEGGTRGAGAGAGRERSRGGIGMGEP